MIHISMLRLVRVWISRRTNILDLLNMLIKSLDRLLGVRAGEDRDGLVMQGWFFDRGIQ